VFPWLWLWSLSLSLSFDFPLHTLGRSFYWLSFGPVFRWTLCLRISVPQGINGEVSACWCWWVNESTRVNGTLTHTPKLHTPTLPFKLNDTAPTTPPPSPFRIPTSHDPLLHFAMSPDSKRDDSSVCVCAPITSSFCNAHAGQKETDGEPPLGS